MARRILFLILSVCLFSLYAVAGSPDYFRIARVSYVEGKVSFQHSGDLDWSAANINMPLEPGDRLYTGDGGRAEIEFDDGSIIRLASGTDVELLAMRDQHVQMRMLLGLCFLNDRSSVDFEINTPAAAFTTQDKGLYRFEVAENGDTTGIVRKGEMEAANNRFSRRIESGEMLQISAAENATEVVSRYAERDAWDEWNDRRNADLVSYNSRKYLPDYVYYGVGDLDRYGRWIMVDGYGYGWVPRVSFGWSPYWDGRWCYRPYFGWTWVSYEPWGWLPYHYGRWYHHISFGWCWLPGPFFGFHFWSPGLVRFYHGRDWISWCALGPGDYYNINNYFYHPTYRYYINNLRLTQRRGPADLINRNSPGAMRSVRPQQFLEGGFAREMAQSRSGPDIGSGDRMITDRLDIQPTARSYAPAPERAAARPASDGSRSVVVRTAPEVRSPNSRYQQITNPAVATPRSRADVAGREATGNASSGARSAPDREAQARAYQVPSGQAADSNPAMLNRNVPRGLDRQDAVPRGQQPPVINRTVPDMSARRLESQPQRSVNSDSQRMPRNEAAVPASRPSTDRSVTPQRPEVARPQTPPANNKPPDSRVIKKSGTESARSSYYAPQAQRYQQSPASVGSAPVTRSGSSASYAEARTMESYAARSTGSSAARPSAAWSGAASVRPNRVTGTGGSEGYSAARSLGFYAPRSNTGTSAARPSASWSGAPSVRAAPMSGMGGSAGYSGSRSIGSSVPRSMGGGSAFGPSAARSAPSGGAASRSSAASPRRR